MNKEFIQRLTEIIEANLENEAFGIEDVVKAMGMSHSNLHRRLKIASNQSISQFIREIRLKKAKELLQNEELTVSEISYRVGFGSPTYFNKCFHEYFGYSPGELKIRESRNKQTEYQATESVTKKGKTRKPVMLMSSFLVLSLIAIFFIFKSPPLKSVNLQANSIAVLPFEYIGNKADSQYLADGMMRDIRLNLSKIKDLRVIDCTPFEQYRNTKLSSRTIGQQLGAAKLLKGSFQMDKNKVHLILEMINTSDESYEWANQYDREWKDILSVQCEVAETIAAELKAIITPQEKQLIRKFPTTDLTAYDFYLKGKDELTKFENGDSTTLEKAHQLYHKALEFDSTFAKAYTGLAYVYIYKQNAKTYALSNFLDSVLFLTNMALHFDPQLAEAYFLKGVYYRENNNLEKALDQFNQAIKFDPNNGSAYIERGHLVAVAKEDYVEAIKSYHEGVARVHGKDLQWALERLGSIYNAAGFKDKAAEYFKKAFVLHRDSALYFWGLSWNEFCDEHFEDAIKYGKRAFKADTGLANIPLLYSLFIEHDTASILYAKKNAEIIDKSGFFSSAAVLSIGYIYWQAGMRKEAEYYFEKNLQYCSENIKMGRYSSKKMEDHINKAFIYAFLGKKEEAYQYLDMINKKHNFAWYYTVYLRHHPMLNNIRGEPRFQVLLKDAETKFNREHERVRKWLEKEGML